MNDAQDNYTVNNHDFIRFLTERRSTPAKHLVEPAPSEEQLRRILAAAHSAPDHGRLTPWRFLVIAGDDRHRLGDVFVDAMLARQSEIDPKLLERERERALRTPMIVAAIACITANHPKVPAVEQRHAAVAATTQLMLAANAEGFGTIWLTGSRAHDRGVMDRLGLDAHEELLGFINLGSVSAAYEASPVERPAPEIVYWSG